MNKRTNQIKWTLIMMAVVLAAGITRPAAGLAAPCESVGIIQVIGPGTSNTPANGTITIVDDNAFSGGYIEGTYTGFRITGTQDATINALTATADLTGTLTASDPTGSGWFTLRFEGQLDLASGVGAAAFTVVEGSTAYEGLIGTTGTVEAVQIASGPTTFQITDIGLC